MIIEAPKPKSGLFQKYRIVTNIAVYLLSLIACCTFIGYNLFPIFVGAVTPPKLTIYLLSSVGAIFYLVFILTVIFVWKQRKYFWAEIQSDYSIKIDDNTFTIASNATNYAWDCMLNEIEDVYIVVSGGFVVQKKKSITKKLFAQRIEKERLINTVESIKTQLIQIQ